MVNPWACSAMTTPSTSSVVLSASMAIAAGFVGSFALMRRMTLAADALSHVALPGIGIAILLRIHPLLGAVAALAGGALIIWLLENRTRLATETVVGVVFSTALAVGVLLASEEELIGALFGATGSVSAWEMIAGLVGAGAVIAFLAAARDRLVIALVSRDIALVSGIDVRRLNLLYLLALALTVALGLRYLGVLLMGSLIIIPAATARPLASGLTSMLAIAVAVALLSTLLGIGLAVQLHRESGPVIVIVAATCFLLASLVPSRR